MKNCTQLFILHNKSTKAASNVARLIEITINKKKREKTINENVHKRFQRISTVRCSFCHFTSQGNIKKQIHPRLYFLQNNIFRNTGDGINYSSFKANCFHKKKTLNRKEKKNECHITVKITNQIDKLQLSAQIATDLS